ncbi:GNAT family N-acetyltransferase, partial [Heyndrickxia oleronia]
MEIREYHSNDEVGWLRCRALSFLHTAYYDNVLREKEHYKNPSIELIAIEDGIVVGLL